MRPAVVVACLLFGLLGGCASTATFTRGSDFRTGACEQRTPEVFAIRGKIDAALADCVRATMAETTRELALDTVGGSVDAALDIAERMEGRALLMRVEGECNSSCANYFLPLARRIEVAPDGMVLLHGSVDPWTLHRFRARRAEFEALQIEAGHSPEEVEADFAKAITGFELTAERQAVFARRHGVAPGWLLYRTAGSGTVVGLDNPPPRSRAILVEERMMRTCLPGVEVAPYQATLERHWIRSYRWLGLKWARIAPSGQAACSEISTATVTRP